MYSKSQAAESTHSRADALDPQDVPTANISSSLECPSSISRRHFHLHSFGISPQKIVSFDHTSLVWVDL